jgi:hypothetical protein
MTPLYRHALSAIGIAVSLFSAANATDATRVHPAAVKRVLDEARKFCEGFENGKFSMGERAITQHELSGDKQADTVIDASEFRCSSMASAWGGTGGSSLWVVIDGKAHNFLARRWGVVKFDGQNVLMTAVHPSECGYVAGSCYRSHLYYQGRFYTPK